MWRPGKSHSITNAMSKASCDGLERPELYGLLCQLRDVARSEDALLDIRRPAVRDIAAAADRCREPVDHMEADVPTARDDDIGLAGNQVRESDVARSVDLDRQAAGTPAPSNVTGPGYDDLELTMEAPLAPNINNKGTAFGGSIASICLFGGWAVSTLSFIDRGIHNTEIVVYGNEMTFERPARGLLNVRAFLDAEEFETCAAKLTEPDSGRIRFDVRVELSHDDKRCAVMRGVYVVWLK